MRSSVRQAIVEHLETELLAKAEQAGVVSRELKQHEVAAIRQHLRRAIDVIDPWLLPGVNA